jgi:hypothetical protein
MVAVGLENGDDPPLPQSLLKGKRYRLVKNNGTKSNYSHQLNNIMYFLI